MATNITTNPFANCTGPVTLECPLQYSPLTYRPSLAANTIFLAVFILCALVQLFLGIRYRTWTYFIALFLGAAVELIGYLGRIRLNTAPWDAGAFTLQITLLIIAPAFVSAGIYLTLKHFVLTFGREYSLLKPALYTWIFICADIFSLLVQAAGAALFANQNSSLSTIEAGAHLALAGIVFQVVSLAFFGLMAAVYVMRMSRNWSRLSPEAVQMAHATRTHLFLTAVIIAYVTVLTRCIYRIPELAGGYQNAVYVNETDFIVLDGVMISIATVVLTVFHPGIFFPPLSKSVSAQRRQQQQQASAETYIELHNPKS